jgi:ribulose-5-phosphate 4-epimerase/fuculose-1-phosphate aldolase
MAGAGTSWTPFETSGGNTLAADQALRHDLALANRIIERFHLSNAFGHVSARVPGTNTFLFPTRRSPGLADENNLLLLDTDGNRLEGEGQPNTEFWIHARIYAARPDVNGVVHAHPLACIALTQIRQRHRVVHHSAGVFGEGVPEYEPIGLIRSLALGDDVAKAMASRPAVMMRGHGIAVGQPDVRAATVAACFLEESADLQLRMLAAAGGDASRLREFTLEEAARVRDQLDAGPLARAWEYYATAAEARPLGT